MLKISVMIFLGVLSIAAVSGDLAWSENTPPEVTQAPGDEGSEKKGAIADVQDQFFIPIKPEDEKNFLLLDPDGKTPADSGRFLSILDHPDKKPDR